MAANKKGGKEKKTWSRHELELKIETVLLTSKVEKGFLDLKNFKDFQKFSDQLVEQVAWRPYVAVWDIIDIFTAQVTEVFESKHDKPTGNLKEILTAGQLSELKQSTATYLFSLPRQYYIYFELPSMPKWGAGDIQLSERVALIESADPTGALPHTIVQLRVSALGFGAARVDTTAVTSAFSTLKHFCQIVQHRSGAYSHSWGIISAILGRRDIRCHLVDRKNPQKVENVTFPSSLSKYISAFGIDESKLMLPGSGLLSPARLAATPDEKRRALATALTPILKLFDGEKPELDALRIQTAMEWAFDSEIGENQTLSFLQACIGLEALLGDDKKDEPLTARLADRCAYLLGRGEQERQLFRTKFEKIYDLRSKLVHGRKPRLDLHDVNWLFTAQSTLAAVIWKETDNLRAIGK